MTTFGKITALVVLTCVFCITLKLCPYTTKAPTDQPYVPLYVGDPFELLEIGSPGDSPNGMAETAPGVFLMDGSWIEFWHDNTYRLNYNGQDYCHQGQEQQDNILYWPWGCSVKRTGVGEPVPLPCPGPFPTMPIAGFSPLGPSTAETGGQSEEDIIFWALNQVMPIATDEPDNYPNYLYQMTREWAAWGRYWIPIATDVAPNPHPYSLQDMNRTWWRYIQPISLEEALEEHLRPKHYAPNVERQKRFLEKLGIERANDEAPVKAIPSPFSPPIPVSFASHNGTKMSVDYVSKRVELNAECGNESSSENNKNNGSTKDNNIEQSCCEPSYRDGFFVQNCFGSQIDPGYDHPRQPSMWDNWPDYAWWG